MQELFVTHHCGADLTDDQYEDPWNAPAGNILRVDSPCLAPCRNAQDSVR